MSMIARNPNELKASNSGIIGSGFIQVLPNQAINSSNLSQSPAEFRFSVSGNDSIVFSKSFFRIQGQIGTGGVGTMTAPLVAQGNALCENFFDNILSSCSFRIGNQDVSVQNNKIGQLAALKRRLYNNHANSRSLSDTSVFGKSSLAERVKLTSVDALSDATDLQTTFIETVAGNITFTTASSTFTFVGINLRDAAHGITWKVGDYFKFTSTASDSNYYPYNDNIYQIASIPTDTTLTIVQNTIGTNINATTGLRMFKVEPPNPLAKNSFEFEWTPAACPIFDVAEPFGSGQYSILLNFDANYQNLFSESLVAAGGTGYTAPSLKINKIELYLFTEKTPRAQDGQYFISLKEMSIQQVDLNTGTNPLTFQVPSSTQHIAVFAQQKTLTPNVPADKFLSGQGDEKSVTGLQLTYANVSKPQINKESLFNGTTNYLTSRYYDNILYSNMVFSEGGTESYRDWLKRGVYYFFDYSRDSDDKSTLLNVNATYSNLTNPSALYCVAFYNKIVSVTVKSGQIVDVQSSFV